MEQELKLTLKNKDGEVQTEDEGKGFAYLAYHREYALGDYYEITVDQVPVFLIVQLDSSIKPALIYLNKKVWRYYIPFNVQREWPYPDNAFLGKRHYAEIRKATAEEINLKRNLAQNSHDQREEIAQTYPHASANAETRNEMVFFAKNAIDGIVANEKHGSFPFQSWGVNQQNNAEFTLDFGRNVVIDEVCLVLRADYPHDSYWVKVTILFSDGTKKNIYPEKTSKKQRFTFDKRTISYLKLTDLIKDKDNSNFPALSQIEVYGTEECVS
ncbi:hypothetical protein HXW78_08075 [Tetragenococcus halophilus]|uniref:hypothetical protein n=1 Tax=Tetragenococcus halophilus TaxID=51669 RepID=UPI0021BA6793|nr:hypothetical protein [Tetragenococcus halophilus]MCT8310839.1 hypothetical protein [Tetragenococcus halophilus]